MTVSALATDIVQVKRGQVWQLGAHRLMCGDSGDTEDVARLMSGKKADLVFTSPPYASQRVYKTKALPWNLMMQNACLALPCHDITQVMFNIGLFYRQGQCVYYWQEWLAWMVAKGWRHTGWYIWDKLAGLPTVPTHGRLYPSHEFIFHFCTTPRTPYKSAVSKSAGRTFKQVGVRKYDGTMHRRVAAQNIVCHPTRIADSVARITNRGFRDNEGHPAVYPVQLPVEYNLAFCDPQDSTYDPFCGSGTPIIAAERTGRVGYGMEIAPEYVAMALRRYAKAYPDQLPVLEMDA